MSKKTYKVVGIMSGTSLDGIDLAHLQFFKEKETWHFEILECQTVPYSKKWLETLKIAATFTTKELEILNIEYTTLLGEVINTFISENKLQNLDAICSHGHTILHQPQNGFTLQIGNLTELASITKQKIVCDFRIQDVQLGGQGAPLVPIGDALLFAEYDYCLNLGGFSNVSFAQNNHRIAFDICAVNTVLNFYANQLGFAFDNEGEIARAGAIDQNLLQQLNGLDFYKKTPPKSLGIEYVTAVLLPLIEGFSISAEDKITTFTEHIAVQIAHSIGKEPKKILVTGGGAYNKFLLDRMQFHLKEVTIIVPPKKILEYKEAMIFGFLGVLKMENEINILASVTGATQDHCAGIVLEP